MGTAENLAALSEKLRATRERLQATADRAAALQRRLRADAPTIVSLDQLTQLAQAALAVPRPERFEGDELSHSDAWEISLINEEG
jgi:hypothetical protein